MKTFVVVNDPAAPGRPPFSVAQCQVVEFTFLKLLLGAIQCFKFIIFSLLYEDIHIKIIVMYGSMINMDKQKQTHKAHLCMP